MVRQLINDNYNPAANQFVITTKKATYFQSYSTVIAKIDNKNNLILSSWWDYSRTTMKHLYIFMRDYGFGKYCGADNVRKAIKNGDIVMKKQTSLTIS